MYNDIFNQPIISLRPKRGIRTIVKLRRLTDVRWTYDASSHTWGSLCGYFYARRVHTGGYDYNGEPLPGSTVFIYVTNGQIGGTPIWDLRRKWPEIKAAGLKPRSPNDSIVIMPWW